jgi:hypothetical protein
MTALSEVTKSNLDKLPPELYEWHCFAIPLRKLKKKYLNKANFGKNYGKRGFRVYCVI